MDSKDCLSLKERQTRRHKESIIAPPCVQLILLPLLLLQISRVCEFLQIHFFDKYQPLFDKL